MKTRIIVDSTADLTPEFRNRVSVVPLTVHFGDKEYKFIGCIALPEVQKPRPIKLNTRQGVAVEYLPSAI